jgi:HlyD family secretion protein
MTVPRIPQLRLAAAAAALACLLLAGCQRGGPGGASGKGAAPPASPYAAIANGKVDIEGGVIEVAARRPGTIREVLVREGDLVKRGQVLARQEDDDTVLAEKSATALVAQAQSQLGLSAVSLATAQREYQRLQGLLPARLVAQQQVDQAADALATARAQQAVYEAAVATAQAQLAQARYNRELTVIRAPLDGKIIKRLANPGAGASTLQVSNMFDLAPDSPRIVRAEIIENSIPDVHVGQDAEIVAEADAARVHVGRVIRIASSFGARKLKSDAANEATDERVVEVVVTATGSSYLIGQRVLVKFMKPGEQAGAARGTDPVARPKKP